MKRSAVSSKRLLLLALVIVLVSVGVFLVERTADTEIPRGYVKVQSYVHTEPGAITCAAIAPNCGVCEPEGKIIHKQCYVPKDSPFANL